MGFSRQPYWSGVPCPPPGDLPNPGIKPRSPALQADSLLSESPGKPKNTGMGSLSLLQGIFQTQGSNPGLQHCRQILYHLSHQGNPPGRTRLSPLPDVFNSVTSTHIKMQNFSLSRRCPHSPFQLIYYLLFPRKPTILPFIAKN